MSARSCAASASTPNCRRPWSHPRLPKDTIFLAPGTTATLAMRFDGPADPTAPHMYQCHLLWHEDRGMMGQFVVVEPGQQAATPPRHAH
ncbi:multicopper oxidase domain-containing protein [Nocardia mangyaensis]|uniref:multicopper oxidase domain-containing protein n=1 Tax=Nocardia mangyaensis TaxID=2213200 RepID=UPI003B8342B1